MVFTGDWNGGEREFRLRFGQRYELARFTRIDPATGGEVELTEGDLDDVDEYAWHDSSTLRWRGVKPAASGGPSGSSRTAPLVAFTRAAGCLPGIYCHPLLLAGWTGVLTDPTLDHATD